VAPWKMPSNPIASRVTTLNLGTTECDATLCDCEGTPEKITVCPGLFSKRIFPGDMGTSRARPRPSRGGVHSSLAGGHC
jgi:hypothetical protein